MSRLLRFQLAIVVLLFMEVSCRKKRDVALPPLPAPPPAASTSQPPGPPAAAPTPPVSAGTETHPAITSAPASSAAAPSAPATSPTKSNVRSNSYQLNRPPKVAAPATHKASRSAAASNQAAPPSPPAQAKDPLPPPQLVDIVPPDQQRQLNAAIDQSLSSAQASLNSIGKRQLSDDQKSLVGQIQNMIQQAQDSRRSDLAGAKSLAERAEVLAKDLAASFR